MLDGLISRYHIPTQSCVLTHVTNTIELINRGVPVDLTFQSLAGTEKANASFGISLSILDEAWDATKSLRRGTVGDNCMYFETGQGTGLSANANFGCDEQTIEARTYAVARRYRPLIVNTVVGFMGPEYLANGKQIIRRAWRTTSAPSSWACPWGVTSATRITLTRIRMTWMSS